MISMIRSDNTKNSNKKTYGLPSSRTFDVYPSIIDHSDLDIRNQTLPKNSYPLGNARDFHSHARPSYFYFFTLNKNENKY